VHLLILPLLNILFGLVVLFVFSIYISSIAPIVLPLIIIIILVGYALPTFYLKSRMEKVARKINKGISNNALMLRTALFYRKDVEMWELRNSLIEKHKAAVENLYEGKGESYRLSLYPKIFVESSIYTMFVIVILFSNIMENSIEHESAINFFVALFLLLKALPYAQQIYYSVTHLRSGKNILMEFEDFLNASDVDHKILSKKKALKISQAINLKNISYKLNDEFLFKDVSINIPLGSKVAIVGQSGSGKSTLLNIICGYLRPTTGTILIDNENINNINISSIISYVSQRPYIFESTVLENITFSGSKNEIINRELLNIAIKTSMIEKLNTDQEDFLNKSTGESGGLLSGGQVQRVALARAIYSNRPILMLDEFTSALDKETSLLVVDQLLKLPITILAVTHDIDVASKFGIIINIEDYKNKY